jgi:hypothetical protein
MSELKHWLDEGSEADEFERSVLRAGLEADPRQATQDQIWSSLMRTLAIAPLVAVATSAETVSAKAAAVSKASAVWFAVAKGFVVGLAVYGGVTGVVEVANRFSSPALPPPGASRVTAAAKASHSGSEQRIATPTPAPAAVAEDAQSTPHATQRVGSAAPRAPAGGIPQLSASSVAAFADPTQPGSAPISQLDAEARALRRARDELRKGKLADAFALLEASQRQFSAAELYQEREALMIELLYRSGQTAAAEQRARAFLGQFPESPHAHKIRLLTSH